MYIDLVLCKQRNGQFLFYAPAWSHLEEGTDVELDTKYGVQRGEVLKSVTVEQGSKEFDFVIMATNATLPLKRVLAYYTKHEIVYKEVLNGSDNDTE